MHITVNGEVLERSLIDDEVVVLRVRYSAQVSPEKLKELEPKIELDARENAIERLLLVQEARNIWPVIPQDEVDNQFAVVMEKYGSRDALSDVPESDAKKMKAAVADSIRLTKYFVEICKDVSPPTDEECRAYFEAHGDEFKSPEMIRASHIVRQPGPDEDMGAFSAEMLNIRERAVKGEDFARLARKHSQCSDNDGSLGWFRRGAMVNSFEKVVFALEPGQISDVFRTEFGYHIAMVHERRPSAPIPFERARKDIAHTMLEQRKNDEIGRTVDRLRKTARVVEA